MPYWRLSSFYFFYFAILGAWMPFWSLYLEHQGFDIETIGYLMGLMMLTKVFAPSFWSVLANYCGSRIRVIRWGALLAWLSFLGVLAASGFWWYALVIVLFSFFWNAILAQFEVLTFEHLGTQYRRYGLVRLWGSIGFILAGSLLGYLFDRVSIDYLPWVLLAVLVALCLSSVGVSEGPGTAKLKGSKQRLGELLRRPCVMVFFIGCFLMQVAHGPYYTFFSIYLEHHGYSSSVTGLLWSLGVLAEVLLFMVMHRLMQRFSLRQIMMASFSLAAVRWLLTGFFVDELLLLLIAQCLHAASFGSFHVYCVEVVRRMFSGGLEGQGMALYSGLSFGGGGAVGAVLSGWLWSYNPLWCFLMAAGLCLLALLLSWRWPVTADSVPQPA
ncbi:MAG: MFS transporter [Halieaceae bacterium]|nr:MFS transporter [Halieaceae bacterium]